tara:strand:+ start:397 stop:600 length:204 start_codon:yes stop_codon:yes gene_type:complete
MIKIGAIVPNKYNPLSPTLILSSIEKIVKKKVVIKKNNICLSEIINENLFLKLSGEIKRVTIVIIKT